MNIILGIISVILCFGTIVVLENYLKRRAYIFGLV